jgi:hypothetical protein
MTVTLFCLHNDENASEEVPGLVCSIWPKGPRGEEPMPHKLKVGDIVSVRPAMSRNIPGGVYEVTQRLPEIGGEFHYRIKSVNEPHERVVRESELTKT